MKVRIIAVAAAVAVLSGACADVTGAALEVNGETFDRSELVELLEDVRDEAIAAGVDASVLGQGTLPSSDTSLVLTRFVQNELLAQWLQAEGVDVSAADIAAALEVAPQTGSATLDALSAERDARALAAQAAQLDASALQADVVLDPRFGQWDPASVQVLPN